MLLSDISDTYILIKQILMNHVNDTDTPLVRFGLFGTAKISHKVIRAISKSFVAFVTVIGSRDPEKAREWARSQSLSDDVVCCSYAELVESKNVDCVYIPLPCALRKQWAIAAARAGKGVLIEKPTALNTKELKEIIAVCNENKVQFMDGTHFSHHSRLVEMKKFLDSGAIGPIVRINSSFSFFADDSWLSSNIRTNKELEPFGCLGDLSWYNIRFCLWALDLELPISAKATCEKWSRLGTPIDSSCHLYWANGVQAQFDSSFVTAFRQCAEISCTKGTLSLNDFVISRGPESAEFKTIVNPDVDEHHERVIGEEMTHIIRNCNQEVEWIKTFSSNVLTKTTNTYWPDLSLKTQIVLDALMDSLKKEGAIVKVAKYM